MTTPHGLLVAQMLAHIDLLDAAIAELDASLTTAAAPFRAILKRVCTIPGIRERTAIMLLAECGADMSVFRTAGHLGRYLPRQQHLRWEKPIRPDPTRLRRPAHRVDRSRPCRRPNQNTYLAAHHAHIRGRRGLHKAIGATRHDILIAYWHVVHDQVDYADLGPDWAQRHRSTEYRTRRLVHQLEQLGHTVPLQPTT